MSYGFRDLSFRCWWTGRGGHMKLHKQVAINKILLCMLINSSCIWRFDSICKVFVSKNNSNFQPGKLSCDGFIVLKLFVLIFALIVGACDSYEKNEQRDFRLNLLAGSVESITELKERWFFCEKCLSNSQCKSEYVKQCKTITIPDRSAALSQAVVKANVEAVYFLVDVAKTDVNGVTGRYNETPLMIAAYYGTKKHQDIADFLISRGASVNAIDLTKMTVLETAIWKNNLNFARLLIENGANPSLTVDGEKEGAACISAIRRKRFNFISIIPGCCTFARKNPDISSEVLFQCP